LLPAVRSFCLSGVIFTWLVVALRSRNERPIFLPGPHTPVLLPSRKPRGCHFRFRNLVAETAVPEVACCASCLASVSCAHDTQIGGTVFETRRFQPSTFCKLLSWPGATNCVLSLLEIALSHLDVYFTARNTTPLCFLVVVWVSRRDRGEYA
jgi:hypothetical protein